MGGQPHILPPPASITAVEVTTILGVTIAHDCVKEITIAHDAGFPAEVTAVEESAADDATITTTYRGVRSLRYLPDRASPR